VVVDVPEVEVRHLSADTPGVLTLPDVPGFSARLKLSRAAGTLRSDTRTQRIEMDLPNADGRLKAGLYGQVRLTMEKRTGVVVLPAAAVGGKGAERFVFLAVEGKAAKRPVEVGFTEGGLTEIRPAVIEGGKAVNGLSAGEAVIVPAAGQILQDGQTVEAAPTTY
jgi:multidrug efflux pump subunit AcrA (membrane-fusion protein)